VDRPDLEPDARMLAHLARLQKLLCRGEGVSAMSHIRNLDHARAKLYRKEAADS
jgi:hypothetical protein